MAENTELDQANEIVYAAQQEALRLAVAAIAVFNENLELAYEELGSAPISSLARDTIAGLRSQISMSTNNIGNVMMLYGMNADGTPLSGGV